MLELTLPYPPSVNHYWIERAVKTKTGKFRVMKCIGAKGKAFREAVAEIVPEMESFKEDNLLVTLEVYVPDKRKRDLDNVLKATLDALEHAGVYEDDSQIQHLIAVKHEKVAGGKLIVTIQEEE